jgi:hypothetical protein
VYGLNSDIRSVKGLNNIPFLPIEFFKSHVIITGNNSYEQEFISSGTTSELKSKHFVKETSLYEKIFNRAFRLFYGEPSAFDIFALLPGYMDRKGSSLIYMMENLVKQAGSNSGFYLTDHEKLFNKLITQRDQKKKTILFGVTHALIDFSEKYSFDFPDLIIMETGGMKGRRKEMIREEIHSVLCKAFSVTEIHSEYGMTELLSQAYSKGRGIFYSPPWMQFQIRDVYDPLKMLNYHSSGGINIIDLANIDSCSFIATDDLGKLREDGSLEILGRFDHSDVRGCNLMIE